MKVNNFQKQFQGLKEKDNEREKEMFKKKKTKEQLELKKKSSTQKTYWLEQEIRHFRRKCQLIWICYNRNYPN